MQTSRIAKGGIHVAERSTARDTFSAAGLATLAACGSGEADGSAGDAIVKFPPKDIPPTAPTPTPSPPASPSPAPAPTPAPSPSSSPTPSPTQSPGPSPTPSPSPTPTPAPTSPTPLTLEQASRFLAQATTGASKGDIVQLARSNIDSWIKGQFAMMRGQSHWNWMKAQGYDQDPANANPKAGMKSVAGWDRSIWRQLISAPDQLRQRVALALLDVMVVSADQLDLPWPQFSMAAYMDNLLDHAFGNFRDLLGAVTKSSAMGQYLTYLGSQKADGMGILPDENFAREVLQLFTLGLYELNQDGTHKTGPSGLPIETYTQTDISQLAQIFTGFELSSSNLQTPDPLREPLVINPAKNETDSSTFLGWTVSGGGMAAVDAALDIVHNHPNVPPFIAKALIQRLVTSNPSPDYVKRVADTFSNNGAGERGDLSAVVYAILVDPEARSDLARTSPHAGKLRDPVQRVTQWARAFSVVSMSGTWSFGDMTGSLAQAPGRSPSVFNFFRPGYVPPSSELALRGLVAPEFQITNEQTIVTYVNSMQGLVKRGVDASGDMVPNYSTLLSIADNSQKLVDEVNLVLAAGQLSTNTRQLICSVVESIDHTRGAGAANRVYTTIMLVMASPEYLVMK